MKTLKYNNSPDLISSLKHCWVIYAASLIVFVCLMSACSRTLADLSIKERVELDDVFPRQTQKALTEAKWIVVTDMRKDRDFRLADQVQRKELLDAIYFDAATGGDAGTGCWDPDYQISTFSADDEIQESDVAIRISYKCGAVKGSGVDLTLIQGHLDGDSSRSKPILERITGKKEK